MKTLPADDFGRGTDLKLSMVVAAKLGGGAAGGSIERRQKRKMVGSIRESIAGFNHRTTSNLVSGVLTDQGSPTANAGLDCFCCGTGGSRGCGVWARALSSASRDTGGALATRIEA